MVKNSITKPWIIKNNLWILKHLNAQTAMEIHLLDGALRTTLPLAFVNHSFHSLHRLPSPHSAPRLPTSHRWKLKPLGRQVQPFIQTSFASHLHSSLYAYCGQLLPLYSPEKTTSLPVVSPPPWHRESSNLTGKYHVDISLSLSSYSYSVNK